MDDTFNLGGGQVGAAEDAQGMVFDLSGVEEDKKFELIPKGTYAAVVDSFEYGESAAGNPMITVIYEITDPEFENRKLYDFMVLSGKAAEFGMGKLKKFLVRLCPEANLNAFNPKDFADSGDAVGRECQIAVKISTQKSGDYKGEKRNNVADILAPATGNSFI